MLSISMTTMTIACSRNLIQHIPHIHTHIDCIDSLFKRIQSSTWPSLELTHTNISMVICGFTHYIITPIHSTVVYSSPRHSLHIDIWPQSRVFPPSVKLTCITQANTPHHRIHHEHWIIRGIFIRLPQVSYGNLLLVCEDTLRTIPGIRGRSIPQWRMLGIKVSSHIYFYRVTAKCY
jgi:hypothetical protein